MEITISPKQAMRAVRIVSRNGRRPTVSEISKAAALAAQVDRLAIYAEQRPNYGSSASLFFTCTR